MALARKTHTLTFLPASEPVNVDGMVQLPAYGGGQEVRGQLTPLTSNAAYERTLLALSRPHLFLYEIADEAKVAVGHKATLGTRVFEVMSPPMKWDAIAANSCMECVLEERDFG
jgi:hypothetical protein